MKAIELPINVMVILAIALIVLVSIILIFTGIWNPSIGNVQVGLIKSEACGRLVSAGCTKTNAADIGNLGIDLDNNGVPGELGDNLLLLCQKYYSANDDASCKQLCGC